MFNGDLSEAPPLLYAEETSIGLDEADEIDENDVIERVDIVAQSQIETESKQRTSSNSSDFTGVNETDSPVSANAASPTTKDTSIYSPSTAPLPNPATSDDLSVRIDKPANGTPLTSESNFNLSQMVPPIVSRTLTAIQKPIEGLPTPSVHDIADKVLSQMSKAEDNVVETVDTAKCKVDTVSSSPMEKAENQVVHLVDSTTEKVDHATHVLAEKSHQGVDTVKHGVKRTCDLISNAVDRVKETLGGAVSKTGTGISELAANSGHLLDELTTDMLGPEVKEAVEEGEEDEDDLIG